MAIEFTDGFDAVGSVSGLDEKWTVTNSGTGLSLVTGQGKMASPQAVQFAAAQLTTKMRRSLSVTRRDNQSEHIIFGFWFRCSSLPSGNTMILSLISSNGTIDWDSGGLGIQSDGTVVWLRSGIVLLASSTSTITPGAWHHMEFEVEIADAVRADTTLKIGVDGAVDDLTGTIQTVWQDAIDAYQLGVNRDCGTVEYDHFYVILPTGDAPTTMIGATQITTLYPNSNGTHGAWTGDYQDVDEGTGVDHDGDTTVITSGSIGAQESYHFDNLVTGVLNVDAVSMNIVGKRDDSGSLSVFPFIRTSGINAPATKLAAFPTSAFGLHQYISPDDGTGTAFTPSTVNASEWGMEVDDS
jgi:hypothetical protein